MSKMTLQQMITQLAGGMAVSTQIFVITLLFSLPLGLVIAFGRMSKNKLIQTIVKVYISIMRGTPLMLQLMVVYFGPYYLFRIKVGSSYRLWACLLYTSDPFLYNRKFHGISYYTKRQISKISALQKRFSMLIW